MIRGRRKECLESYFACFSAKLIVCQNISDKKARGALWNGLLKETSLWQNVYNKNPTSHHYLVSLMQNEIYTEDTIENWKTIKQGRDLKGKGKT